MKNNTKTLQLAIFGSVLTQISSTPSFLKIIVYLIWGYIVIHSVIVYRWIIPWSRFGKAFFIFYFLYFLLFLVVSMWRTSFQSTYYLRSMIVPMIATLIARMFKDINKDNIQLLLKTYVVSALIFGIWVNANYFASYGDWYEQIQYVYAQKNSAAQIWCSAIIILVFGCCYSSNVARVLGYMLAIYFLFLVGVCQCRSAILGMTIVTALYILLFVRNKILAALVSVTLCFLLWKHRELYAFVYHALALRRYSGANLDLFTSGRLTYYKEALLTFSRNPFFGVGRYYVDNSYLMVLAESGIAGFILIESIAILRFETNIVTILNGTDYKELIFCFSVFYFVESIFEGLPPFGPGVSSFMFWFVSESFCIDKNIFKLEHKTFINHS